MNMKVQSIKSYINFASVEKESQKTSDIQSADAKKEKREKLVKYSIAAAAAAAVVIGGLYYLGRRGGKVVKNTKLTEEASSVHVKPEKPEKPVKPDSVIEETPKNVKTDDTPNVKPENVEETVEPERPKSKRRGRKKLKEVTEDKINPSDIPDAKKPFVLDKKYFDFSKIEGERKGNVVKQIENGKVKREFAADDGEHLSFYSEFDDSGVRTMDVEFRGDTTVKSIRKYKNGEFSKISFYEKDGITLAKNFEDEDEALRFGLDFE